MGNPKFKEHGLGTALHQPFCGGKNRRFYIMGCSKKRTGYLDIAEFKLHHGFTLALRFKVQGLRFKV